MQVQVKICGLTRYEDAALAVKLGADYIGFIFAASPRQITVEKAAELVQKLEENGLSEKVKTVGVFVNEQKEIIEEIIRHVGIDLIQLHGDETDTETQAYSFPWYKALRIRSREDVENTITTQNWHCPRLLIDTKVKGTYGGTGISIDEDVARYAGATIRGAGKEFFLAGGIGPENVFQLLNAVQPDGIDVGSCIEEAEGKKSVEKMAQFFEEIERFKRC